jgi:hypothetical protein
MKKTLFTVFAGLALAAEVRDSSKRRGDKRAVSLTVTKAKISLQAKSKTNSTLNQISWDISALPRGLETRFRYKDMVKSKTEKGIDKGDFRTVIKSITEFVDKNKDGKFDKDDEVIQRVMLSDWKDLQKEDAADKTSTGTAVKIPKITAQTKDGMFSAIGRYSGEEITLESDKNTLKPAAMKFDYVVQNWKRKEGKKGDHLAVEVRFFAKELSKKRPRKDKSDDKTESGDVVSAPAGEGAGEFTWKTKIKIKKGDKAAIDGDIKSGDIGEVTDAADKKEDVLGKEEKATKMYFAVPLTDDTKEIRWDPTVGISDDDDGATSSASASTASASLFATGALLLTSLFA